MLISTKSIYEWNQRWNEWIVWWMSERSEHAAGHSTQPKQSHLALPNGRDGLLGLLTAIGCPLRRLMLAGQLNKAKATHQLPPQTNNPISLPIRGGKEMELVGGLEWIMKLIAFGLVSFGGLWPACRQWLRQKEANPNKQKQLIEWWMEASKEREWSERRQQQAKFNSLLFFSEEKSDWIGVACCCGENEMAPKGAERAAECLRP